MCRHLGLDFAALNASMLSHQLNLGKVGLPGCCCLMHKQGGWALGGWGTAVGVAGKCRRSAAGAAAEGPVQQLSPPLERPRGGRGPGRWRWQGVPARGTSWQSGPPSGQVTAGGRQWLQALSGARPVPRAATCLLRHCSRANIPPPLLSAVIRPETLHGAPHQWGRHRHCSAAG